METVATTTTKVYLSKDDKHLKNFTIWKNIYKQLADVHLQYAKSLVDVATNAEIAFRNDTDILHHTVMIDIGQILINELKSQAHVIKDKWDHYNEDYHPYDRLSQIDGKNNKSLIKAIQDACAERKTMEDKVKRAQKKYFRAFDETRSLMEKIEMYEDVDFLKCEMLSELTSLKSKTDVYLAKYKSTYQNEVENREEFQGKMKTIENLWKKKEKENIETWIDTCTDLCNRLDETSPRCFTTPLDEDSPYPALVNRLNQIDLDELVNTSLQPKLELHTFPVYKERRMEDIRTPPGSGTRIHRDKQYQYTPDPSIFNNFIVSHPSSSTNTTTLTNTTPPPGILITDETRTRTTLKHQTQEHHKALNDADCSGKDVERADQATSDKEDDESSTSDIELIDLEGKQSGKKSKNIKYFKKNTETDSTSSEESTTYTTRSGKLNNSFYDDDLELIPIPIHSNEMSVCDMENVYVAVVKEYIKQEKNELDLKLGMQIKQKQGVDENGMAFGWYRKNKMSGKKYGYYPADHVALLKKSTFIQLND